MMEGNNMKWKKNAKCFLIGAVVSMSVAGCSNNVANPESSSSGAASSTVQTANAVVNPETAKNTGIPLPFELQWGSSEEDCAAKFQNNWTKQELGTQDRHTYTLNQKQSLFGREGTVIISFAKNLLDGITPNNSLPDYYLDAVSISFESPMAELQTELTNQYGAPIDTQEIDYVEGKKYVLVMFSTPNFQVKNITNEQQKKAYHMYQYIVMNAYGDLEQTMQVSIDKKNEHRTLYTTNPEELWNQIKDWNFPDGEKYFSGISVIENPDNENACSVLYHFDDIIPFLS